MNLAARLLVGVVALEHVWILILEMFLWQKPLGRRVFGTTAEQAKTTSVLAANQGLYNGILAAGCFWGLFIEDAAMARQVQIFFLSAVAAAGVFGGWTVNRRILFVQGGPALIGLGVLLSQRGGL